MQDWGTLKAQEASIENLETACDKVSIFEEGCKNPVPFFSLFVFVLFVPPPPNSVSYYVMWIC
jgi:hypothetical protein